MDAHWWNSFRPGHNAVTMALQGALNIAYYYHTMWMFKWGDYKLMMPAQPHTFGTLYFLYMMMSTWEIRVKDRFSTSPHDQGIALYHIQEKLEFLNKKLFDQLQNQDISLDKMNLETAIRSLDCIYCLDLHCHGLHPEYLLIQLLSSSSCWFVHHYHISFCVSNIFQVWGRKYCFFLDLTRKRCYFVCQREIGLWDPPLELKYPPWKMTFKMKLGSSLQFLSTFEMYTHGIEVEQGLGWVDLKQLKNLYLRFQIFDWRLEDGSSILGLNYINPAGQIQKRVKGFIHFLNKTEGTTFITMLDP